MTKKVVSSSNLALRFYRRDGWKAEDLLPYVTIGDLLDTSVTHNDKLEDSYFLLAVGGRFNTKKLYEEQVLQVVRRFNDDPTQTDVEFMEQFNW